MTGEKKDICNNKEYWDVGYREQNFGDMSSFGVKLIFNFYLRYYITFIN